MIWASVWSGVWILALGLFLLVAARSEWTVSGPQPELLVHPVGELQRDLPRPMSPGDSVARLEQVLDAYPHAVLVPVLDERGAVSALVTRDAVNRIPPAQRGVVPIRSLSEPMMGLPRVHPTETVDQVVHRLGRGRSWWALVVDGNGVEGVLCSADVDEVLEAATA
jgi:hypothetical protein